MQESRLGAIPFFATLSKEERRRLSRVTDLIEVEEGRKLVRQGEFAYEFFVLEDGAAEVTVGEERVAELGPGDFFGEMGLMADARRNATVTVTSPASVVVMTGQAFRQMAREMPAIGDRLRAEVEERCRPVNEKAA